MGRGVRAPGRRGPRHARGGGPAARSARRHSSPVTARRPTARSRSRTATTSTRDRRWPRPATPSGWGCSTTPAGTRRSAAAGWRGRSGCSQDAPADAVEHGYQAVHEMFRHIFAGEFPAALELSERIAETGGGVGDAEPRRPGPVEPGAAAASTAGGCRRGWPCSTRRWSASTDPRRLADHRRARLLLDGRGLPGDRGLPADDRVDDPAHPVVPDAAGPRAVHRAVRGAPGADHAVRTVPSRRRSTSSRWPLAR